MLKNKEILPLKKGLYTSSRFYLDEPAKLKLGEFLSSQIYTSSYLSLEYILQKHDLLKGFPQTITCVTSKTNRSFKNFAGTFQYSNLKVALHFGLEETLFHGQKYFVATKAKALFDYLYLQPGFRGNKRYIKQQLFENLDIQWNNFSKQDFELFDHYVWKSNSKKMMRILDAITRYFTEKDFNKWAAELLK